MSRPAMGGSHAVGECLDPSSLEGFYQLVLETGGAHLAACARRARPLGNPPRKPLPGQSLDPHSAIIPQSLPRRPEDERTA